jgi:TPR repeat protein
MLRCLLLFILGVGSASAAPLEEWQPYAKTGLFPAGSPLWLAPDMEKEPIPAYTARLMEGARSGDAKAMATLGRFFFVRGDADRAHEWLGKAAHAGHAGAQLDFGLLRLRGISSPANSMEAYAWLWLATRNDAPGAEETFRQALPRFSVADVLGGMRLVEIWSRR